MSTRRGKFISVDDLVDESILRVTNEIKSRNPDLSDKEIEQMTDKIGIVQLDSLLQNYLLKRTWHWDEALSIERDCASIQYAYARAS